MRERHVVVDGRRTKVLSGGEGRPLLYLHGAGGETMWLPFHDELARRFALVAPAHPGFDSSEGLEEIDTIEDLAFHYLDFLSVMGWDAVDVVGVSLGGWIAAELAVRWPARVRRLVLVDAAGLQVPGTSIAPLWEHARDPDRLRRLLFADPDAPLARMLVQHPDELPDEMLLLLHKAAEATARVGWNPHLANPKLRRRLGRITAPTLVVWGADDKVIPPAHGRAYAEGIPGARFELIERCGHMPPLEAPFELVARVAAFLEQP